MSTGTIEPTGDAPPEANTEAPASIIPSVAEEAPKGSGATRKLIFVVAVLALLSIMAFVLFRITHRPEPKTDARAPAPAVAVAGTQAARKFGPEPSTPDAPKGEGGAQRQTTVPAIKPDDADPIGVRRTSSTTSQTAAGGGRGAAGVAGQSTTDPRDAPILLTQPGNGTLALARTSGAGAGLGAMQGPIASESTAELVAQTREQLARYKQELLQRQAELRASVGGAGLGASPTLVAAAPGAAAAPASVGGTSAQGGILDGSLKGSATTRVRAGVLGNRSLMLPRGSSFTCALKNRVISAQAGFVGCQVMRDVFSDNGKVLLVPRGSHLDGEYKVTQVRPGTTRIPVLWTRLRTPDGVTVDLDSPATGGLGESGSDAYVDNRWIERIGAALLVSVIEDSINIVVNNSTAPPSGSNTVVFQGTAQTASKMAEKVLDSTVNLPPLMYQNQGGIVGVYIAHDIDFSSVYELQPVAQ